MKNIKNKPVNVNNDIFIYVVLILFTFFVYGITLTFSFGLDDNYILNQMIMSDKSINGFFSIFCNWYAGNDYRPITVMSFWIERNVFGSIIPSISHLLNVAIFSYLIITIYRFIKLSDFFVDNNKLKILALLSCLLFIVHPNHVSVVANIKSRDNLLSMLFGLLASIQFLQFYKYKKLKQVILYGFFMFISILCKLDSYVFSIVPILVVIFYSKEKLNYKFLFLPLVIFLFVFILKGILEHTLLDDSLRVKMSVDASENPLVHNNSLYSHICMSLTTMLYYFKFLVIPHGYYFYFGYNQIPLTPIYSILNLLSIAIYTSLFFTSMYLYKQNKLYLFCYLFFLFSIAYSSNLIITIPGIVMDRYNFIASLGFCIAFASILIDVFNLDSLSIYRNKIVILILSIYLVFTFYRISAWKDTFTLYNRDIKNLSKSVNALRIISVSYIKKSNEKNIDKNISEKYMNLANEYIDKALAISSESSMAWEAKGLCYMNKNDNNNALKCFFKSKECDSTYLSGINYIGVAYGNLNNYDSAYYYYNYVVQRENKYSYSAENLINLLINNNKITEADSVIKILLHRFPDDINLINKYISVSDFEKNNSFNLYKGTQ